MLNAVHEYTHTPFSALDRDRESGALNETALNGV